MRKLSDKLAAFFGFDEEVSPLAFIMGPLFLLLAIVLALKTRSAFNYDLLFVAVCGLVLTAKWKIRGCVAAILLLAFSAGAKHVLAPSNHGWQACLEGSIGVALFISALVFEESSKWVFSKQSEIERNEKTILFLEEDLSQQKELATQESAAAAEKLGALRLQLEESESQISTLQVLNDVLRKAAAKSIEEKEVSMAQVLLFDRREGQLLEEIDSLQSELNRIGNESVLAQQNKQLFNELNEARVKEAQTHLINETLVRLHAKENQKAREFEAKFIEMDEEIQKATFEKANASHEIELLASQIVSLREGIRILEEIRFERDELREAAKNASQLLEASQKEQDELREMVATLKQEVETLHQKSAFSNEEKEQLVARLEQYRRLELLYRQLKAQFEEKNQILHQTRVQLFHADTELQTIQQKLQEKDLEHNPVSKEVYLEIEAVEEENSVLCQENQELQDLVSHLMQYVPNEISPSVKKKMKRSVYHSPEQASLF
jgi:chromosome segregation ATPase